MRSLHPPRRRLAYHLVSKRDGTSDDDLTLALAEAGIDLVAPGDTADAIIVDLSGYDADEDTICAVMNKARQDASGCPLLAIISPKQRLTGLAQRALQNDLVFHKSAKLASVIRTLRNITTRTTMAKELGHRVQAATALGLAPGTLKRPSPARGIMLMAEPGPLALDVLGQLSPYTPVSAAMKSSQVLRALESRRADALVILSAKERRPQATVVKLLRRHAELFSTPIITLEPTLNERTVAYWQAAGADDTHAIGMAKDIIPLIAKLRGHQRNETYLRRTLDQLSFTAEGRAGKIASNRFFEACLAGRVPTRSRGCVLALRLVATSEHSSPNALAEASACIAMATEPADLVTRVAGDTLLLSLPDSAMRNAQKLAMTLTRMTSDLRFGPSDDPCTYRASTCLVPLKDYKTAREVIRAAVGGLRTSSPSALVAGR